MRGRDGTHRGAKRVLTAELVVELAERHAAGESPSRLVRWLQEAHGVEVSHMTVRRALARLKAEPEPARAKPVERRERGDQSLVDRLMSAADRLQDVIEDPETPPDTLSKASTSLATVTKAIGALRKGAATGVQDDERVEAARELVRRLEAIRERRAKAHVEEQQQKAGAG